MFASLLYLYLHMVAYEIDLFLEKGKLKWPKLSMMQQIPVEADAILINLPDELLSPKLISAVHKRELCFSTTKVRLINLQQTLCSLSPH